MNVTKKLVDQLWDKHYDLFDEYLTLGQDILPYIENKKTIDKITDMFNSVCWSDVYGDKENKIENKLQEIIEKEAKKIKNEDLKNKIAELEYKMFQYWSAYEILDQELNGVWKK